MNITRLHVKIIDQTLQLANRNRLASGSENIVQIVCDFCSKWEGCGKAAVFYKNKDEVYHVPLVEGAATVPHEMLADKGSFYFGVLGTKEDGVRTTEVLRVNVVQGALTSATAEPEDPTPDIYEQLLAAYAKAEESLLLERARIDSLVAMCTGAGTTTHVIDNDILHAEIRTNGAEAIITYQIKDLHLDEGARYDCFDIPQALAPMVTTELSCSMTGLTATLSYIEDTGAPMLQFYNLDTPRTVAGARGEGRYPLGFVFLPELADIRIGKDGTAHETAGEAVRAQAVLVDSAVTANSKNPVESGAIAFELQKVYNAINELEDKVDETASITVDDAMSDTSTNPVQNKVVKAAIDQATEDAATALGNLGSSVQSLSVGLGNKQDTLVSGTNIKTINGQSILGSGNITIEGGGGASITVDSVFSETSENPVQNKVITAVFNEAVGMLTSLQGQVENLPATIETYVEQYISEALGGEY